MEIELKNLDKCYNKDSQEQVHAVKSISLKIPSNQIFGIIGKSGAGKSTLVRMISLLEKCDSGEILYDGERVDNLSGKALIDRRRRIGMIFQNFNLFSSRTAIENIAYPLEICGTPKNVIKERTQSLIELVGLKDRADSPISTLSGGQKQRIAIARALAVQPDILFCDEATSALDPQTTTSILNLIRDIQKKMNLTVVMITHQMEVVRDACKNVAVINDGEVVETGSVESIFMHPKSETTKAFISKLAPGESSVNKESLVRWSKAGGKYILRFNGYLTGEPLLSRMAKNCNVDFNIRAGGVQSVQGKQIGTLITDITGPDAEVMKAVGFLRTNGVVVEIEGEDD